MKIANIVKGIFGRKVKIEATSMSDLVEKLKWAEVEVSDTQDALTGLKWRLQHGVIAMEDIETEAAEIAAFHLELLEKAKARRIEFTGQVTQVDGALNLVKSIYDKADDIEDELK